MALRYTDKSSSDPRGVVRAGGEPDGAVCSDFCTVSGLGARAGEVGAATRLAGETPLAAEKAERLEGEIMRANLRPKG